ncbi:two-component sensor histidine kinase [Halobacillus andaensis]|uniref:histidine kinase n=1 Tax=Halobacillus andaensis TaxID=1176239 RepID=A0A917B6D5_HALAA|nr:HAMP domain-containing sensor histidine kinase [Halobacillus andaensis]MBP2005857.1 signal transduction histidine kinase [Halobacillus andaensis]GGF25537.1 two-component sensor histidine kinase [Halobacillus andaensis]
MRNKISVKLGLLFFILILLVEFILFVILYTSISNDRIDEVMEQLLARGNSHRDVLEKNFNASTLDHVALMESEASTDVVILGEESEILAASTEVREEKQAIIETHQAMNHESEEMVEERWKTEPYVATISPILINDQVRGYVYMFSPSEQISDIISQLARQFMLAVAITVVFTMISVMILTKFITKPLIKMKEQTELLSQGKTDIELQYSNKDELGVLAQSIQKLAEDLGRLKEERSEFLSAIAHELRTPLTYLKGYADIVSKPGLSEEQREKYISIIKEESVHLTHMVQELFELAKMDNNSFSMEMQNVNVVPLLHQVKDRLYPVLEEKKMNLMIGSKEEVYARVDPTRFKQVVMNVLDNAIHYSPADTTVQVTVESETDYTKILVQDEGPGVPEEAVDHLFERLYRVEKSRSRAHGGSGLGLSIVKEIIHAHGGEVRARNGSQGGLVVTMKWPKEERK